jgi:Luciferase-like monooxygenase
MQHAPRPCFGIATAPQQVDYHDILRVWREADTIPAIEHAWVFDHLRPIFGDPDGPIFEGWTLLSALAAHTRRLRLGVMVTSNRFRPPAMLAKIACPSTTPSELLDRYCAQIGRDPASITRSIHLPVSYDQPGVTQDAMGKRPAPASGTSCAGCRPPGRPTSHGGSPTSSSARRRGRAQ